MMKVWFPEASEEEAVEAADGSAQAAAERYARADYSDQWESCEVCVRDSSGDLHRFTVSARVEVHFNTRRK